MKKNVCRLIFASLLICSGMKAGAQMVGNCTVNAGGNAIVCGSFTTLTGTVGGNVAAAAPLWTFISGPVTPVIVSPNSLVTDVTGMTVDGDYRFQLRQTCAIGFNTSQVVITAHARPASFTAGPDITDVCAATGTTNLGGVIPAGYTGEWRAVNIWRFYRASETVSTNAQFSSTTVANPDFSLVNKANHGIDPAYWAILRITSADGVCSYEDTTVVRFIPNPVINPVVNTSRCQSPTISTHYITLSAPPYFNTNYPGVAGAAVAGTTISLNVISQPAGANMSFDRLDDNIFFYFNGVTQPGTYTFTITVTNSCGTYTSPTLTYSFQGVTPRLVNLQPVGHEAPEQLVVYATSGSGGEVHCNIAGTTTPQSFYFSVDPADLPTVLTTVTPSGIIPAGGPPTVTVTGAGTYDRVATAAPPAGGWRIGTYRFTINTRNADGSCGVNQTYYIHVSDRSRPDVEIADVSVCYPGTGAISATITLPAVYKGIVNSSYFQDFDGHYDIQLVSAPAGAATPTYTTTNLRSLTSTSTVISNLNRIGDYSFRITPVAYNPSVGPFLVQEYACAGTLISDTFMIRVEGRINSNAGSDQVSANGALVNLAGNNPGLASGSWSLVSSPSGSSPQITNPSDPLSTVTNLNVAGAYEFAWTITTPYGGCVSIDTTRITITTTLNVKWLYFNAGKEGTGVVLNWATATEQNNSGFDIERSADGIRWQAIGFVATLAPAGNSDQSLYYRYTDRSPLSGTNFYRLKQTDWDGTSAYSNIDKVTFNDQAQLLFQPNPVNDRLTISGLQDIAEIQLLNTDGRILQITRPHSLTTTQINMSGLPAGLYLIKTTGMNGKTTTHKISKR